MNGRTKRGKTRCFNPTLGPACPIILSLCFVFLFNNCSMAEDEEWDDYGQIKQALADQGFSHKLVDNFLHDCEACTQTYRGIIMTTRSDIADFSRVAFSGFDTSGVENFYQLI